MAVDRLADSARIRVLHVPQAVGGNASSLARAEREVGLDSLSVTLERSPYGYHFDEVLWREGEGRLSREWKRVGLLARAISEFDVIHFNFGQSILTWNGVASRLAAHAGPGRFLTALAPWFELVDLPILKRAGKVIAVTYQGDDARQGDFCRKHFAVSVANFMDPSAFPAWRDARRRACIAKFARYADLIYALNPDLMHVLPERARFMPYANVNPAEWQVVRADSGSVRRPVVVHAPSDRGVKGTEYVLAAVNRLASEGIEFEFRLIEGVANAEARRMYEAADLAIDQLLAGWYGGFAVEVMSLGKPVVAYIRESDLKFVPEAMRAALPVIRAEPATIYGVLREMLTTRRRDLAEIGSRSRDYVEAWHDPLAIAGLLKADYRQALRKPPRSARMRTGP